MTREKLLHVTVENESADVLCPECNEKTRKEDPPHIYRCPTYPRTPNGWRRPWGRPSVTACSLTPKQDQQAALRGSISFPRGVGEWAERIGRKHERRNDCHCGRRARGLRQDMARLGSRLEERINGLESRLDGSIKALESRFDGLERQFGELRERMAHLEGLLEGLREAITGRAAAS